MEGFKFIKLIIWQKAMDFGEEMNELAEKFPNKEISNLSSQLRRAADSIALNISEGSILQSKAEYRKFLGYSIRSLAECVTCLHKANRRKYLELSEFQTNYQEAFSLMNMLVSYRSKVGQE